MYLFVTMNKSHSVRNVPHDTPNIANIPSLLERALGMRPIYVLIEVHFTKFHVDKIIRRVNKLTMMIHDNYVLVDVSTELINGSEFIQYLVKGERSERFY